MVGLGEGDEARCWTCSAISTAPGRNIVTIGQYLSPGPEHLPVHAVCEPGAVPAFRLHGETELSFLAGGQLRRSPSSFYHAGEVRRLMAGVSPTETRHVNRHFTRLAEAKAASSLEERAP